MAFSHGISVKVGDAGRLLSLSNLFNTEKNVRTLFYLNQLSIHLIFRQSEHNNLTLESQLIWSDIILLFSYTSNSETVELRQFLVPPQLYSLPRGFSALFADI